MKQITAFIHHVRTFVAQPAKNPGEADGNTVAEVVDGISHDGGTVCQPAANKFNNRKSQIEEKGPANTFRTAGVIVVMHSPYTKRFGFGARWCERGQRAQTRMC